MLKINSFDNNHIEIAICSPNSKLKKSPYQLKAQAMFNPNVK
jgi:hypothetical protein